MNVTACDREPIHVPGAIQPHGVLLVLCPESEEILQAAGDIVSLLGVSGGPLGRRFPDLVGISLGSLTEAAGLEPGKEPAYLGSVRLPPDGRELDILAHSFGDRVVVELEPSLDRRPSAARMLARLRSAVAQIKTARTVALACTMAADEIRSLTGFDRVMAYQFLENGAGKVVADSRAADLASFLNHHYPASDIPRQARALYLRNHIRVIPDVAYVPAPLVSSRPEDVLDMSDCSLRSVSPTHIEYLKNKGVAASMSVSVIRDDALWGLIACHHRTPRLVPYEVREACRQIAGALTQQLETIEARDSAEEAQRLSSRREKLLTWLAEADLIEVELQRRIADLAQLIPCDGVAVCHDGKSAVYGITPSEVDCLQLSRWARRHDSAHPYMTDRLAHVNADASAYVREASGLLAVTVSLDDPIELLWFRAEYAETIEWAGHPHKTIEADEASGRLTPRRSFQIWRETVKGQALPWTEAEIDAARRLRDGIERIRERQRLDRLQSKVIHMSRMSAMGAMASTIAHELNQPLTAARNYVSGSRKLLEAAGVESVADVVEVLDKAADQTLRAGEIVRHLRQLVFHGESEIRSCDLGDIIDDACALALLDATELGLVWDVQRDQHASSVFADHIQIQQVLINLIRNAVDAMADAVERRLHITTRSTGAGMVEVSVSDTGSGIAPEIRERLFSSFNTTKDNGMGIGLSICRTIVEGHDGQIWAADREGGGACFTFTLRAADADD